MNENKSFLQKLIDPKYMFLYIANKGYLDFLPDKIYLKLRFLASMDKNLNLVNPKTFNEKLQWLKLYDRNPIYPSLVDKISVRKFVTEKIGEKYLIPLIGIWENPEEIQFDQLPDKFVLKCNHNSGAGITICTDKSKLNKGDTIEKLKKATKINYFYLGREWPYKVIKPKILCEKYITDNEFTCELTDYKFFCFNGFVESVMLCIGRNTGKTKFFFFDEEWNLKKQNINSLTLDGKINIPKPDKIKEMFELAGILSIGFPFVRVDLYYSRGSIYFGEMTFYPDSGFDKNILPEYDNYYGDLIDLNLVKRNK